MCELERDVSELDSLRAQLAKANERIAELESYNIGLANESHNKSLEIDKANERVKELEQNQLLTENGKNRYGLDVSYFRNVINRELNRPLANHKPDELARVFARLSRTADESVMFEPEFSDKFAIAQKIEGIQRVLDCRELNLSQGEIDTINLMQEQLRKEQDKC